MIPTPAGESLRFRFEPLVVGHAMALAEALLDPAAYTFIAAPAPDNVETLRAQFARRAAGPSGNCPRERWWNIAVFSSADNLGLGRLEATLIEDRAEVAYLFGSRHWGNGYAFEAMGWLHDRLREDGTASKLWATVLPTNHRSVRLLQRLGYTQIVGGWPDLVSYDPGDLVFSREAA